MQNDDTLAAEIRTALEKQKGGLDQWREATLELAVLFAKGRALHESDQAFGRWLVDHELDEVGRDDRAAYIRLGLNLDRALEILCDANRLVSADTLARRLPVSEVPIPAPAPSASAEAPEKNEKSSVSSEPVAARERSATTNKSRPPRIVMLIGERLGRPVFDRIGSCDLGKMLCDIAESKGGKAAVKEYAEVLIAHSGWKPVQQPKNLTTRCLHKDLRDTTELAESPKGLRRAIALALEEEKRAKEPPRPSLIEARGLVFATDRDAPTAKIEPFERPCGDADIVVYGTVIRRSGEHVDHYQEAWAAARFVEMIEGAERRPDSETVERRGVSYGTATHYLRCGATQMFCHYWHQIALAMSRPVDRTAGIRLAPAMRRAA